MSGDSRLPDDPRDAHLLAALRHAPDRDLEPPAEVTAQILAAARAAVGPEQPTPGSQPSALRQLARWLSQPQVSAAFGTLAVAALVGILWSTQEPPVREPQPVAVAPQSVPDAAASAAVAAAPPPVANEANEVEPAAGDLAQPVERRRAPSPAMPMRAAPPPSAAPQIAAAAGNRVPTSGAPSDEVRASAAAPAPPPPSASVAKAAESTLPGMTGAAQRAEVGAAALARREAQDREAAPSAQPAQALAAKASALEDPLASVDALLSDPGGAAVLRWEVPGVLAHTVPHGDVQRDWWARLRAATRGRWAPVPESEPPLLPSLVLRADERERATLGFDDGGVVWVDVASGRAWRAPIAAAAGSALRADVAGW